MSLITVNADVRPLVNAIRELTSVLRDHFHLMRGPLPEQITPPPDDAVSYMGNRESFDASAQQVIDNLKKEGYSQAEQQRIFTDYFGENEEERV